MLLLVCLVMAAQPEPVVPVIERHILPFQADLSVQASLTEGSRAGGSAYVGGALGLLKPSEGTPFFGGGLEIGYALSGDPYQLSYGLQLRAGYAWSSEDTGTEVGRRDVLPDAIVYGRVTPFLGAELSGNERTAMTKSQVLPGVRAGLGVTCPWWTRQLLLARPFATEHGFLGETLKVLSALVFGPVALLNHAEFVIEVTPHVVGPWVTAIVRLGSGF